MKPDTIIFCVVLIAGCRGKKDAAPSCESVAKRLVELDAGDKASFMTEKERTSRAQRWMAKCEPMSEAERRCVLSSPTMEEADACEESGSAAPATAAPSAKAAWVVQMGDAAYQDAKFVALAPDGDVIAVGNFRGVLDLGGQTKTARSSDAWVARLSPTGTVRWIKGFGGTGRDYVKGLSLASDDSITVTVRANEEPRFLRITLAADGTPTQPPTPLAAYDPADAAAHHANGDIVVGSRMVDPPNGETCDAFLVQRFAADGKHLWSRCNDKQAKFWFTEAILQLEAGPEGVTALCAGFVGALGWGGKAAPDAGDEEERAFVLLLDAKGVPRWVDYFASERGLRCEALTVADDGNVFASLSGNASGSTLRSWNANGAPRWTRGCAELVGKPECELSAITTRGTEVVVAAQAGAHTVIATIDGKTGATTQQRLYTKGTRIQRLAARADAVVFATDFVGAVDFGTGMFQSPPDEKGSSVDALIGRVQ